MKLWNAIGSNHVVLTECQTRRSGSRWAQATGMFESEELDQLRLGWLLQEDLAEIDHRVGVRGLDDVPGEIRFSLGKDSKRMNHGGAM